MLNSSTIKNSTLTELARRFRYVTSGEIIESEAPTGAPGRSDGDDLHLLAAYPLLISQNAILNFRFRVEEFPKQRTRKMS